MHREILGLKKGDGKEADHINGNGLDNRIENLRTCTRQQNMMNCRSPLWKKNGYKGVSVHKTTGLWRARINFNGKEYSLKYHKTKEDAALAYNKKALELFGQFAKLNKL